MLKIALALVKKGYKRMNVLDSCKTYCSYTKLAVSIISLWLLRIAKIVFIRKERVFIITTFYLFEQEFTNRNCQKRQWPLIEDTDSV